MGAIESNSKDDAFKRIYKRGEHAPTGVKRFLGKLYLSAKKRSSDEKLKRSELL